MRIFMIGQKGIPSTGGGVERHVEELATRLVASGHDIFVYARKSYSPGVQSTYKGVNIIHLPTLPGKGFETWLHTLFASFHVLFQKADVIHYHAIGPASFMFIPRFLARSSKLVFTHHCQDYLHQKWGLLARCYLKLGEIMGCRLAHQVITVSRILKSLVKKKYQVEAQYVPNGVPDYQEIKDQGVLSQWNLNEGGYILAVSRFVPHKGLHYLISAYQQLKTDKKLVLAGGSADTKEYEKLLHDLAQDNPNIIFTGYQKGKVLQALFERSYCFVQPSEAEGLSIALLEAMKMKAVCLVSNIPENKEALEDNGFYFKNRNIKDLESQLNLLLNSPRLILSKKKTAYSRVCENYDWKQIVTKTESLYAHVLA